MSSTNIYTQFKTISKYNNFKPTRLYIKRHSKTGLLYFGKTIRKDIYNYEGSGIRWNNHLNKHGRPFIETIWVSEWFDDPYDIEEFAIFFSNEYNIVNSDKWANLMIEDGLTGGSMPPLVYQRAKQKEMQTKSSVDWISNVLPERNRKNRETVNDPEWQRTVGVEQKRKEIETKSSQSWKDTIGADANRKHSETMNDPDWIETTGKERSRKHRAVKSDTEWQRTIGAAQKRKQLETKSTEEWKNTIGEAAHRKYMATISTPEWKAATSERVKAIRNDPIWKETTGKLAAKKLSDTRKDPAWQKKYSKTCPHCETTTFGVNYIRWHGDNCKYKKS